MSTTPNIVRYDRPLTYTELLGPFAPTHSFVIYTNSNNEKFIYRGGPDSVTGKLKIDVVQWEKGGPDHVTDNTLSQYQSTLLITGEDAAYEWSKMTKYGESINKANIEYTEKNANCNSSLTGAVEATGNPKIIQANAEANKDLNVIGEDPTILNNPALQTSDGKLMSDIISTFQSQLFNFIKKYDNQRVYT